MSDYSLYTRELNRSVCILEHVNKVEAECRDDTVCEQIRMEQLRYTCDPHHPLRQVHEPHSLPQTSASDSGHVDATMSISASKRRADTERFIQPRETHMFAPLFVLFRPAMNWRPGASSATS